VSFTPVTTPPVPAGWYPDPWRQAWWRWWDGANWTPYTEQSFVAARPEPGTPVRAGGIAILGFLAGIAISVAIDVPLILLGFDASDPAVLLGSSIGLWIGLFGACVIAVRRKGSGSLADLGLVRPRWVDLGLGVGFGVASLMAVFLVAGVLYLIDPSLLPGEGNSGFEDPVQQGGVLGIVVVYLIAVVGAPFFEELFFRGLVQGGLTARWGIATGLIVQAALFALVHLTPDNGLGNVGVFIIIWTVGMSLGAIRQVSHRLTPGIFTHAVYNAIIVTIAVVDASS
jgi:membrane protease YdiL (CAAX protease family)